MIHMTLWKVPPQASHIVTVPKTLPTLLRRTLMHYSIMLLLPVEFCRWRRCMSVLAMNVPVLVLNVSVVIPWY
jgi:hypothetical protein